MIVFKSAAEYIGTKCENEDKAAACEQIIQALMLTAATAAASDQIQEYWLNDGQTQIKAIYRGAKSIFQAIKDFETLKTMYLNRAAGRMTRLMDSSNFTGRNNGF